MLFFKNYKSPAMRGDTLVTKSKSENRASRGATYSLILSCTAQISFTKKPKNDLSFFNNPAMRGETFVANSKNENRSSRGATYSLWLIPSD